MSIPNCFPQNTLPSNLNEFFPELPSRFPPVQLCQFASRNKYNDHILERNENIVHEKDEYFNLTGIGDKQKGYAKNVDVDSELKRINYFGDKCHYDDYKLDPRNQDSRLFKHRDILVKDYIQRQEGTFKDPAYSNQECVNYETTFKPCQSGSQVLDPYHEVTYDFNNDYLVDYPCQKAWNNLTKRYSLGGIYANQDLSKGKCVDTTQCQSINDKF